MKRTIKILSAVLAAAAVCIGAAGCNDTRYSSYDSSGENYDFYLPDYVKVCSYTGIEVPDLTYTPTDEDIDNYVMRTEASFCSSTEDPDRPCRRGDIVDIITTCTFKDNGQTYGYFNFKKNDNGYGFSFVLGTDYFGFPALDEAVEGMTQGETKKVVLPLPDPFYKDYMNSGREVELEIYLNYIDEINYDESTDERFTEFTGYDRETFRIAAKSKLAAERNELIEDYKAELVWKYICDNSKLKKMPEKESGELYDAAVNKARSEAQSKEMTLLEYVQSLGYETLENYYAFLKKTTDNYCYEDMLMYYIIRCENLNYDDDYYNSALLERVKDYQITDAADAEDFLEHYYGIESTREDIRFQYAKDWLADHAKVRDDIHTVFSKELNK